MTTARDVITDYLDAVLADCWDNHREATPTTTGGGTWAHKIKQRLLSAPEPVRLELARQLCPIMIAAFRQIIEINDEFRRTLPPDWEDDPLNDACQAAKKLLLATPSEDK